MKPSEGSLTQLLDLPADLSAKAKAVPGLPERLLRFIRMEVAMNERHQQRYSPEAVEVIRRARDLVKNGGRKAPTGMKGYGLLSGISGKSLRPCSRCSVSGSALH